MYLEFITADAEHQKFYHWKITRISNNPIMIHFLKISDWTGNTYQDRRHMNKYNAQIGAGGTQYAYYHEEDESSFQLVSRLL